MTRRRLLPRHARNRVLHAGVVGGGVALALVGESIALRIIAGWNAAALLMLTLVWILVWRADAEETQRRAAADDPGRTAVWFFALAASSVSLFAAVVVLKQAHTLAPGRAMIWVVLCLLAVVTSWLLTHTSWALRYAHLYYRDDKEGVGGLTFPGDRPPTAFDFAYFAFTLGICFQTSDVCITSPQIRRAVLFHACQAFAYNTAILALALNLAFGFVT